MLMGPQLTSLVGQMSGASTYSSSISQSATGRNPGAPFASVPRAIQSDALDNQATRHRQDVANGGFNAARLSTAATGVNQTSEILTEMQSLAAQASDSSLSNSARSALNDSFQALSGQVSGMVENTSFNGQAVLQGNTVNVQSGGELTIEDPDLSSVASRLEGLDLSSVAGAQSALEGVSSASDSLGVEQAKLGASLGSVERASTQSMATAVNLENAASSTGSSDIAQMTANMVSDKISQAVSHKVIQTQNLQAKHALRLLGK